MNHRKPKTKTTQTTTIDPIKAEAQRLFALLKARNLKCDINWIVEDYAGEYATQVWLLRQALYA